MDLGKLSKIFAVAIAILGCGSNAPAGHNTVPLKNANQTMERKMIDKRKDMEEIKAAKVLFDGVWQELDDKFGSWSVIFPKQIVFLNGAPGAGKGTNTITVMRALEIPTRPVEVSSLLKTPECEKLKEKGLLVGDDIVIAQLINELLKPENARGIIIDGFPRTAVQAYFLKFLIERLEEGDAENRPTFRMINFSVSRQTSIDRQLSRGAAAIEQNQKTPVEGQAPIAVRPTDMSAEAAERRYQIYEESIGRCIMILRDHLEFYEINSEGSFDEVKHRTQSVLGR